jgi:hypothetical protein
MKVTRKNFEKIADQIVREAYGKADLSDAVAKTATEMALPPEAIKTLLQMVNTIASLKHLDESGDRAEAFPLAEPTKVLRIVFELGDESHEEDSKGCLHEKAPARLEPSDMQDYAAPPSADLAASREALDAPKEASADEALDRAREIVTELPTYTGTSRAYNAAARRRGRVTVFRMKRAEVENEYVGHLDFIASEFANLYGPDHGAFEKNAFALYGLPSAEPLVALRSCLHLDPVDFSTIEKTAEVRIIDDSDPLLLKLARMLELNEIHTALGGAIEALAGESVLTDEG